jgi:hypothetical protein
MDREGWSFTGVPDARRLEIFGVDRQGSLP